MEGLKLDLERMTSQEKLLYTIAVNLRALTESSQHGNRNFSRHRLRVFGHSITLLANATGTLSIPLGSASPWVVEQFIYQSTGIFTAHVMTDNANDDMITAGPYPGGLLFAAAGVIGDVGIRPFRVQAGTRLNIQVTDTSAAQNTIWVLVQCRSIDTQLDAWQQEHLRRA